MSSLQQQISAVERAGWDSLCDIGRVVVFSKKLECLLRHLMAAVAAERPVYLLYVQKTITLKKPDHSKIVEQYKRVLDETIQLDRKVTMDSSFQIVLYKACRYMYANRGANGKSQKEKVLWNYVSDFPELTDSSTDAEIEKSFTALSSSRQYSSKLNNVVTPAIQVLRGKGNSTTTDLRHWFMFTLLSDYRLTLGNLRYECLPLDWEVKKAKEAGENAAEKEMGKYTNMDFVRGYVDRSIDPSRKPEIRWALTSVNELRNTLIHFNKIKKTELKKAQREKLKDDFEKIVNCDALFELIYYSHNRIKFQKEYEEVITATEWKAVIDEYQMRLEKLENLNKNVEGEKEFIKEEQEKLQEQLEAIKTELIKERNEYGKLETEYDKLVVTIWRQEKEKEDLRDQAYEKDEYYKDNKELLEERLVEETNMRTEIEEKLVVERQELEVERQNYQQQLQLTQDAVAQRDSERTRHIGEMQRLQESHAGHTQLLEQQMDEAREEREASEALSNLKQAELEAVTTKYNNQVVLTDAAVAARKEVEMENTELKVELMKISNPTF